jgi:hypothetical protein
VANKWYPGLGFERAITYSYHPALHLWTVTLSKITGVDIVIFARIFPIIAEALVIVFFYLALRALLSKEVAIWASLIYNLNGTLQFWELFVREFFALIFYAICIYAVLRAFKARKDYREFFVLGVLATFLTTFSHHWASYNLLITFTAFLILPGVYTRLSYHIFQRRPPHHRGWISLGFVGTASIIVFSWLIYLAYSVFSIHVTMFSNFFFNAINPQSQFVAHPMSGLMSYEKILIYGGWLVLGILGTSELIRGFFKRVKNSEECLFESWYIFCAIYIIVCTFLLPSGASWAVISHRSWSFALFGLSPMVAKSIVRMSSSKSKSGIVFRRKLLRWIRHLTPFLLVFPLISTVLDAPFEIRYPYSPIPDGSFYFAGQWIRYNLPNETVGLDRWSYAPIVPYGRANVAELCRSSEGLAIFLDNVYRSKDFNYSLFEGLKIVVFNKRISEWLPDITVNSSMIDQHCNKIYDSASLALYSVGYD